MKTAILLHGTGGRDQEYFWFDDTKRFLEAKGYVVWWPLLPNTNRPELNESRAFVENNMPELDEESVIIGHSSACPLILSLLQHNDIKVRQVILVAGFYQSIGNDGLSDLMLESSYDFEKIKSSHEIILLNSDNDPWGCDDTQARNTAISLGANLILTTGQGHMGSLSFEQPYSEHDLLKRLLQEDIN